MDSEDVLQAREANPVSSTKIIRQAQHFTVHCGSSSSQPW